MLSRQPVADVVARLLAAGVTAGRTQYDDLDRVWHRTTSLRRPSTDNGALRCVTSLRLVCASCRSEYARASFGDGDGVLGVRRVRPVCRAQRPAVGIDNQTITASCPPRFKRERHARPQQQSAPMPSAIGDVGILVHGAT
jgi:hypothetical protein